MTAPREPDAIREAVGEAVFRSSSHRAAMALAEHLSRLPTNTPLAIEGFRLSVEELHDIVTVAAAMMAAVERAAKGEP